jgi:hypothetical protein
VSQTANTAWKIVSAVNAASHKSLVLWRNDATGAIAILPVTASPGSVTALFTEPNLAWKVVAVGDYDGNGTEDLLWRNDSTGHVWMMLMVSPGDSFAITGQALAYYEPNLNWKVLGAWEFAQ